jgi:uncharacterized coiled-coil protein SlyX
VNDECDEIRRLLEKERAENSALMEDRIAQSNELLSVINDEIARKEVWKRIEATRQAVDASAEKMRDLSQRLHECETRRRYRN